MGVLSRSLSSRLIAVGTLQDCPEKKPSFEEKTRFRRELERDLLSGLAIAFASHSVDPSLSTRLISYRTGRAVNEVQLFCSNRRLLLTENCLPGKMVRVI